MPSLFGYFASVTVDGVPLPEFETETDETTRTVSCWIPSQAGKEFAVSIRSSRLECRSAAAVSIDGFRVRSSTIHRAQPGTNPVGEAKIVNFVRSLEGGIEVQRPFRFSAITPTDEDQYLNQRIPHGLGEILVRVRRVVEDYEHPSPLVVSELNPAPYTVLHENNKKAVAHCVSFGDPKPTAKKMVVKNRDYDRTDPKPFAKFIFKYRPAGVLQADDIMPRPVLKKRKHGDDDHERSSDETQIRNLRVKLERLEDAARRRAQPSRRPKVEPTSQSGSNEVIDLTQEESIVKAGMSRTMSLNSAEIIDLT